MEYVTEEPSLVFVNKKKILNYLISLHWQVNKD